MLKCFLHSLHFFNFYSAADFKILFSISYSLSWDKNSSQKKEKRKKEFKIKIPKITIYHSTL